MKDLTVAICTPIFPNVIQTYILNQIITFNRLGVGTIILAERRGFTKKLPPAISKYDLLNNTTYINAEPNRIIQELLTLPLHNQTYRAALYKIIKSSQLQEYGWRYFIKEIVLAKALTFKSFNVIHSHSLATSYHHLFFRGLFNKVIVTTFHGKEPRGSSNLPPEKSRIVFNKGDAFVTNTLFAKKQLIDMGCLEDKITIIPQGTDLEDFQYTSRQINDDEKIVLLTVSRLSVEKGHAIAIKALSELADEFPTLEYHLVGDGPEKENLEILINRLNLNGRVKLLGLKTGEELIQTYSHAHIFVLPSIDTRDGYLVETQGVVLQEAQASGVPVIGSRTGGISDVIHDGETGMLFTESNHQELAQKIKALIKNAELYKRLSLSGRKDVEEHYDTNVVNGKIVSLYHSLLKKQDPTNG